MPTAADLLQAAYSTNSNTDENRFTVAEDLRTITVPQGQGVLGAVNDHNVRRLWFTMPDKCDGIDLSPFEVSIKYENANGESDRYFVEDATHVEGAITFSWLVARHAFAAAGKVKFSICLHLLDEDDETVLRAFNTTTATVTVLESVDADEEAIEELYSDSLNRALADATSATSSANDAAGRANSAADEAEAFLQSFVVEYSNLSQECKDYIAASASAGADLATDEDVDYAFDNIVAPAIAGGNSAGRITAEDYEAALSIIFG